MLLCFEATERNVRLNPKSLRFRLNRTKSLEMKERIDGTVRFDELWNEVGDQSHLERLVCWRKGHTSVNGQQNR